MTESKSFLLRTIIAGADNKLDRSAPKLDLRHLHPLCWEWAGRSDADEIANVRSDMDARFTSLIQLEGIRRTGKPLPVTNVEQRRPHALERLLRLSRR